MIGLIRLAVMGFIGLSIVYLLVAAYSRSVRREKLEKHWDANPPEGAGEAERSASIEKGMQEYEHGLRKKLIWLVYIIPMIIFVVTVYLVNFQ
jgi:positive regulator of sigma E activity